MDLNSGIALGLVFGCLLCLIAIVAMFQRVLRRLIAIQRYLRRTQRTIEKAELHLRLIKGYLEDESKISEQEITAIMKLYDDIEEAYDRDLNDQIVG